MDLPFAPLKISPHKNITPPLYNKVTMYNTVLARIITGVNNMSQ